ncbi:MAG: amidohydrolase family protein, partial [Acidimicrobiales bacterium]
LSVGITSYTEPGLGPGAKGQHGGSCDDAVMRVYKELAHQGEIPLRVTALSLFGQLDGPSNLKTVCEGIDTVEPPLFSGPTRWQVAGLKLFADIIPLNHGSWMSKPYGGGDCGHLVVEGDDDDERLASFREMIFHAHSAGLQVGVHATGDRAISETVRAFADAIDRDGRDDLRHYVIHGDLTPVETLELMGRTKTGINTQPAIHAIGAARRDPTAPPSDQDLMLRRAVDAGATLCLSSDGPIVTHDWRIAIAACLTRAAPAGSPEQKQRCISLEEAVRGYTINGAWQDHAERWKGSLEVGKVADLCVLSGDLTKTPAEEVPGLEVKMTVVDGEIAFER